MQITLMRHGKPTLARSNWVSPAGMAQWIENYDRSEVQAQHIPAESKACAKAAKVIVSSTAHRALTSVRALGAVASLVSVAFNEAQLPFALVAFPRLPPSVWLVLFRMLWFLRYSRGAESVQSARQRAKAAAIELASLARRGPVLLVGHGIMNRLIASELIASGWLASSEHRSEYWSTSTYASQA